MEGSSRRGRGSSESHKTQLLFPMGSWAASPQHPLPYYSKAYWMQIDAFMDIRRSVHWPLAAITHSRRAGSCIGPTAHRRSSSVVRPELLALALSMNTGSVRRRYRLLAFRCDALHYGNIWPAAQTVVSKFSRRGPVYSGGVLVNENESYRACSKVLPPDSHNCRLVYCRGIGSATRTRQSCPVGRFRHRAA